MTSPAELANQVREALEFALVDDEIIAALSVLEARLEQAEKVEVVANVDAYGVWTMRPEDDRPELRYPFARGVVGETSEDAA